MPDWRNTRRATRWVIRLAMMTSMSGVSSDCSVVRGSTADLRQLLDDGGKTHIDILRSKQRAHP